MGIIQLDQRSLLESDLLSFLQSEFRYEHQISPSFLFLVSFLLERRGLNILLFPVWFVLFLSLLRHIKRGGLLDFADVEALQASLIGML